MQHIKDIGGIQKYFDEIVGSVKNKKKDTSKKSIAENVEIEKPAIPRNYLNQTTLKKFQIQLNEMEEYFEEVRHSLIEDDELIPFPWLAGFPKSSGNL